MTKRSARLLVLLLVLLAGGLLAGGPALLRFLRRDACLDGGGRWDALRDTCDRVP